jgi:uncharacterized membrane protein YbaN (DUF454 family)
VSRLKHPIRIGLGVLFLLLGIIGAFVPIMQGWIFIVLALVMFFPSHPRVERALQKAQHRWPRLVALMRRLGVGNTASDESGGRYNPADSQ